MDECERESRKTGAGVSRELAAAAVRGRDSQSQALRLSENYSVETKLLPAWELSVCLQIVMALTDSV